MKRNRLLVCVLVMMLLVSFGVGALAVSKPALKASTTALKLHPNEIAEVKLTIKHGNGAVFSTLPEMDKITYSKSGVALEPVFDDKELGTAELNIVFTAAEKVGKTTIKIPFVLSDGTKLTLTITVQVAQNYAPRMKWHEIAIDTKTGYPMINLSMTDDFGLRNVCFVRVWTDEKGVSQREIYDIYSLDMVAEAVRYRTLREPGTYSVQINDGTSNRFNSKALCTVLDTDGNGVVDAYYIDDPEETFPVNIPGAISGASAL